MRKNFLNNQDGQLAMVFAIGIVVFGSMFYMWKNVNLSQKTYQKQNKKFAIEIIGLNILERTKNSIAGKDNCMSSQLEVFRNFKAQQLTKASQNFTNLNSVAACLITPEEKAQLSKINFEITTVDKPNIDLLQSNVSLSLEIVSKDKGSIYRKHLVTNLTVASLASFGIIQAAPDLQKPLFVTSPTTFVHIYSRTFIRSNFNIDIMNLYGKNIFYKLPVFIKSPSMQLPKIYNSNFVDNLKIQFAGGIRNNIFNQVQNFWIDLDQYWQWNIDHSKLYDGSGYILPVPGMALREVGSTGGNFYSYPKANQNEVNQDQSPSNILDTQYIASTCSNEGLQAKTFIFMNKDKDLIIDFRGSTKDLDKLPIFCGLVMAKNIIIKLQTTDSTLPHMLMGLFIVKEQIKIEGGNGNIYFVNPLEQNSLPMGLANFLDNSIQLTQISNISQLATNIGKNFTLPVYINPTMAHSQFRAFTPAGIKSDLMSILNCPTPGSSSAYCWNNTVTKPDPLLIFDSGGSKKLVFEISDQI